MKPHYNTMCMYEFVCIQTKGCLPSLRRMFHSLTSSYVRCGSLQRRRRRLLQVAAHGKSSPTTPYPRRDPETSPKTRGARPECRPGPKVHSPNTPHTTRASNHTSFHQGEVNDHQHSFPYSPVTSKQTRNTTTVGRPPRPHLTSLISPQPINSSHLTFSPRWRPRPVKRHPPAPHGLSPLIFRPFHPPLSHSSSTLRKRSAHSSSQPLSEPPSPLLQSLYLGGDRASPRPRPRPLLSLCPSGTRWLGRLFMYGVRSVVPLPLLQDLFPSRPPVAGPRGAAPHRSHLLHPLGSRSTTPLTSEPFWRTAETRWCSAILTHITPPGSLEQEITGQRPEGKLLTGRSTVRNS